MQRLIRTATVLFLFQNLFPHPQQNERLHFQNQWPLFANHWRPTKHQPSNNLHRSNSDHNRFLNSHGSNSRHSRLSLSSNNPGSSNSRDGNSRLSSKGNVLDGHNLKPQ